MRFQTKGTQHYSLELFQNHTNTQLPVQKGSTEHNDVFWKALLSLDSGRQGHSSGVWLSTRWQLLRVPSCLWSTECLGQVGLRWLWRTGSPLRLAQLGGTTESRIWAGWGGSTGDEALWTTKVLYRGAEPWVWGWGRYRLEGREYWQHGKGLFREVPGFVLTFRTSPSQGGS